jgi:glycosyltransferase involved in cell wall biosynthesis
MTPHVLLVVNADWYFLSHRLPLARALREAGAIVSVATGPERGLAAAIEAEGFAYHPLVLDRRSLNPRLEYATFRQLETLYRRLKPDLVHHLTIKPVVYGSAAARRAGVRRVINTIPGLGYMFSGRGAAGRLRAAAALGLYKIALRGGDSAVIFQNDEDRQLFVEHRIVDRARTVVVSGSGVDTSMFRPAEVPPGPPVVMLASRLLWEKGVGDLVQAGRLLRDEGMAFRLVLVGEPDTGNPGHVPEAVLRQWQAAGLVELWGVRGDMPQILTQASIVALPSYYREGVPRVLIEAAACERPLVAADVPGVRDIVQHGVNGLLVAPRSPEALSHALAELLRSHDLREGFGRAGRRLVQERFAEDVVLGQTLEVYRRQFGGQWPSIRSPTGAG